jgi:hypothetical protein
VHGCLAQPENGDVEQFAQRMKAGLKDVADQKCVVAFALGLEPVFENFAGVAKFEI